MSIEEYNYARDPRNCEAAEAPVLSFYGCGTCGIAGEECDCPAAPDGEAPIEGKHFYGADIEEKLPMKWAVCSVCNGAGKHVNPSIDAGGISAADFAEDPDFAEDYWRGTFDQTCNRCKGRATIPVVNLDAMTPEQIKLYRQQIQDEAADRACYLAEMAMGA